MTTIQDVRNWGVQPVAVIGSVGAYTIAEAQALGLTPVALVGNGAMADIAAYLATATLPAGTLTASAPMTHTQRWSNAAVVFRGRENVFTITAADASSTVERWLGGAAGTTVLASLSSSGALTTNDTITAPIVSASSGYFAGPTYYGNQDTSSLIFGVSQDTVLTRDAANAFAQKNGNANQTHRWYSANAAYAQIQSLNESHTLAAAATSDTAIQFPANSIGLGVTIRVTTLITGCATLDVGIAGATTRYGTGIALTANTTNTGVGLVNPSIYAAVTKVRFSAIGGGASFTAGVIRVTMHYISLSAPTS